MNFGISIILKKNQLKMSLNFLSQLSLQDHILKFSNTSKGCQFNSRLAFSLEKVSDSVIFFSLSELIGAFLPIRSPTKAIDFASQKGIDIGVFNPSCFEIRISSSLKVG